MNFETMYLNGEYLTKNPTWDAEDAKWKAEMIKEIINKNFPVFENLIEVGCGSGAILAYLQRYYFQVNFFGYDISPQAITIAKKYSNDKLSFYNTDYLKNGNKTSDILMLIDVIEHLTDFYGFLSKLKSCSKSFIFHIPLDISCRTILKPHINLQQRNSVGHIHYFTEENIWWILKDCGYIVTDWHYTKPKIDIIEQKLFKNKIKKILRNLSFIISKKLTVKLFGGYSLLIFAK